MSTYVMLFRFTQQGVTNINDIPNSLEAAKHAIRDMGGEVKAFYLVMGQYDAVYILEAVDDETAAKIAIEISSLGNVRTETLRAFTEDEYKKIVGEIEAEESEHLDL